MTKVIYGIGNNPGACGVYYQQNVAGGYYKNYPGAGADYLYGNW